METAMITLRMEPQQFAAPYAGFDAADDPDAPMDPTLLAHVRSALAEAKAGAMPGLPILVVLQSGAELATLGACFEVGSEDNPNVTDDQWDSIMALIEHAAKEAITCVSLGTCWHSH
jgi:hypothetical protein